MARLLPKLTSVTRPLRRTRHKCVLGRSAAPSDYQARIRNSCRHTPKRPRRILDRARNRYLSAIKTLATVRRLNLPIVQVNIAEKQINTVGPGALATPQGDLLGMGGED